MHPVLAPYDQVTYVNGSKEHQTVTRYAEKVPAGVGLSEPHTASTDVERNFFSAVLPNKHLQYQVDQDNSRIRMAVVRPSAQNPFLHSAEILSLAS